MRYNLTHDRVNAHGNVVLNEPNGDVHLADQVEYYTKLKNGEVQNLRSTLQDGSTFKAQKGAMKGGSKTTMHKAAYTPCITCNESETPAWAIRASKMTHNEEEAKISYNNARFELWGVPVVYTPYFSHPDGSIVQKSGFLTPSFGYKSSLGAFIENSYYWGIAPDQDVTLGAIIMTDEAPLGFAEYRRRWDNASLQINGGLTQSTHKDRKSGVIVDEKDEWRGHIFADALWNMSDIWRSGLDINWTSDDQYMRQYDFSNEDVLENQIYAERFKGRNYATGRLIAYQDTRVKEDRPEDQPNVLPEVIASFIGEPGSFPIIGGRWSLDTSMLGLRRIGSDQDMDRYSLDLGWKRRLVSDYGLLTNIQAKARADAYYVNDRTTATFGSGTSQSGTDVRAFPLVNIDVRYPMVREFENTQMTIEPIAAYTAAPKVDSNNPSIPNEDSKDVQIDASNLFEPNRFPGLDRLEDQTHATYGLRTGLYGNDGSYGNIFLGQSYRFDEYNNPFPEGSGLSNQESDVVGQVTGRYKNKYSLDYRFQLSSRLLTSERHEVDASADWGRFGLNGQYLFAKSLEGTELDSSREQINANSHFYFSPEWRSRAGAIQDFGENEGLRQVYGGLEYLGQCLFLSLIGQKNYTTEASGEGGTEILFRIGLKNLGDFEETTYKKDALTQCNM
ncbi:MAG: LPS assembly protein LptD [Micavibrio sp.]|nr:LPS assembly protein LptD [Micavibrio sp.]